MNSRLRDVMNRFRTNRTGILPLSKYMTLHFTFKMEARRVFGGHCQWVVDGADGRVTWAFLLPANLKSSALVWKYYYHKVGFGLFNQLTVRIYYVF